ncbi:MAG: hypothetical protein QOH73_770 [Gaiellaceae bacterium]|nr:hypothetical protein [Gaiellaceae bacterium]
MKLALPIRPGVVYGLVKEIRVSGQDPRPLVVAGAPELARALARELGKGGRSGAVREGGPYSRIAALVYVLAAPVTEEDEAQLKAADKKRVPIIALLADESLEPTVPYVLATDVVRVHRGEALPVERIAEAVVRRLGEDAAPLAARVPALRRPAARELVRRFARKNGIISAAVFVPAADLPLLTLNQIRMVLRIAQVYGHDVDRRRAVELIGVLGAGFGMRTVARELLDFVPGPGWVLKGAIAYAGTRALGEAAIRYFEAL